VRRCTREGPLRVFRRRVCKRRPATNPLKIALGAGTWGVRRPVYRMVGAGPGRLRSGTARDDAVDVSPRVKSPGWMRSCLSRGRSFLCPCASAMR
jgi:hypothetical protein